MKVLVSEELRASAKPFAGFLLIAGGVLAVREITGWPPNFPVAPLALLVGLPLLAVASRFLSLAAHECGHALAALALGVRVKSVRISGVCFVFTGTAQAPKSDLGGGVYIEETLERDRPWTSTFISLAGPAADLAIALATGIAALVHKSP